MPNEDWFSFLQFNICWSRITARVWDNCCSFRARRAVDLDELSTLDQLLVDLESSLPPTLLWNPTGLMGLVQTGTTDRYLRLRLIIFEVCMPMIVPANHDKLTVSQRINVLRLFIRSCPRADLVPLPYRNAAQQTETIASDTIDSAVGYLSLRKGARPWCTYLTLLLIEVSSRIAPIVRQQARNPRLEAYRVMLSLTSAQDCLKSLAGSKLSVTHKALTRLKEISEDVNDAYTAATAIPKVIDIDGAFFGDDGQPCNDVVGSAQDLLDLNGWMLDTSRIWQAGDLTDLFSSEDFLLDFG